MASLAFTLDGVLPPQDYPMTFSQIKASVLVLGPVGSTPVTWDADWRHTLVCMAESLVNDLWAEGVDDIYLDGSFLEEKAHPNDIDGYFACDARELRDLQHRLNARNPHRCWTWDPKARTVDPNSAKKQLPMWHAYRTELCPHFNQFSGIVGPTGQPLTFPDAFRRRRGDGLHKGIIRLLREPEKGV